MRASACLAPPNRSATGDGGDRLIDAIGDFLLQTPSLESLGLAGDRKYYYIGTALRNLFAVLRTQKTLTSLDVSNNRCKGEAIAVLGESLRKNKTLTTISLDGTLWLLH